MSNQQRSSARRIAKNVRRFVAVDMRRFVTGLTSLVRWIWRGFDRKEPFRTERFIVKSFIERNTKYLKQHSSGRDLVIYCGKTPHQWDPDPAKIVGGSEEAVINLARELSRLGWNVTVYNSCGHRPVADGNVIYCPFWEFNPRDKQDVVVLWRWANRLDWAINADRLVVDLHDAVSDDVFLEKNRLTKVDRIFVKSEYQRSLLRRVPDTKIEVIPNGLDLKLLEANEEKDPNLLINTSSPDRSLSILPALFKQVRERVPSARLQWAYGWDFFELFHRNHPEGIHWMRRVQEEMKEAGVESLGHLSHAEVGKLYRRGSILAYPTEFIEIDCISVRKAQACGCVPVTTDLGALADSVQFGVKVPVQSATNGAAGVFYHGLDDADAQRLWVEAVVDLLRNPEKRAELGRQGAEWARQFSWPKIAARWNEILRGTA